MRNHIRDTAMKRILLIALLSLLPFVLLGQGSGPLKFLGIPIDGPKEQFEAKLKTKGFRYNSYTEGYKGQFNGKDVDVYIHTNHNAVDRVYVAFPYTTEEGIKVEFNRLLKQFNDTGKYIDLSFNEEIPSSEDISYEITVNNKRYQASFTYFDNDRDSAEYIDGIIDLLSDFISEDNRALLKSEIKRVAELPDDERENAQNALMANVQGMILNDSSNEEMDSEKGYQAIFAFLDGIKALADGDVWFMIHKSYGRYNIGLYYDNLHNQAHGEDL